MARFVKWYVNIKQWVPTREQWLFLTSSIQNEELIRINKFCYKEDLKSSLVGQVLIRRFLSNVIDKPSNEIELIRSDLGRPQVSDTYKSKLFQEGRWPRVVDFNVSHSGDYCVFAGLWSFDDNCPELCLGVDVTKIVKKKTKQELDRFLHLMSRKEFKPLEWQTVTKVDDDRQKCINFTRLWCLKESFIKAIGLGLTFKLDRIEFVFDESYKYNISTNYLEKNMHNKTKVLLDGELANDWRFQETALDSNHLVAIGYNQKKSIECEDTDVNFDDTLFEEVRMDSVIKDLSLLQEIYEQNWVHFCSRQTKSDIF